MKLYCVSIGSEFAHDGYLDHEQAKKLQKQLKEKGYKKVWVVEETEPDPTEHFKLFGEFV